MYIVCINMKLHIIAVTPIGTRGSPPPSPIKHQQYYQDKDIMILQLHLQQHLQLQYLPYQLQDHVQQFTQINNSLFL